MKIKKSVKPGQPEAAPRLSVRLWSTLILFGLVGQIAWMVENMYFNVFLYNTVTGDTGMIAAMVAASAVVATVTTLAMGALSDKLGKRKSFIVFGYLLWGLSVMAFALISVTGLERFLPTAAAVQTAAVLVILLDCVMTFFGSAANDAAFNAWVTDVTVDDNRGRVEAVLAIMPLLAMLVVFGFLDGLTLSGNWTAFFLIVGGLTMAGGALGYLLIQESETLRTGDGKYLANLLYGFRPTVILSNPGLYLSLLALAVYGASQQVYMPYLIIYLQRFLEMDNYALVMGVVLILASLVSVLSGRIIDKRGKLTVAAPAGGIAFVGLLMMFFARSVPAVIVSGTVMLGGSMVLSACLQGLIRDYTPQRKAGRFQGIRILFQALIPMVTGPYIGSAVIGHTGRTYEDLGVVKEVPTAEIFLFSALTLLLIAIPLFLLHRKKPGRKFTALRPLLTPWGEALNRDCPLPEYPRPQLRRDSYLNLNGRWHYAICKDEKAPTQFQGEIIVPFSPESLLSGVSRQVGPEDSLWYQRRFTLPLGFRKDRVLLHFGAVDQSAEVFINGELAGSHEGGYLPFTLDITDSLSGGEEILTVKVRDRTSLGHHAYGKQSLHPGGIWYTPQSGIWQTVWLESVPENYVESVQLTPDFDGKRLCWSVRAAHPEGANVVVRMNGQVIAEDWAGADGSGTSHIPPESFHPWTVEDPFLYDVTVQLGEDTVESYFAMRKVGVTDSPRGKLLTLNGEPIFMTGVLDQGYWPDGLYTAPSDAALVHDIQTMKDLGFNMLRKHIKIEPMRWYYHCDRLGMLVWQDFPSGGAEQSLMITKYLPYINFRLSDRKYRPMGREEDEGRDQFVQDLHDTVELLYNTPSIAVWVPFNEGWGQFDSLEITQMLWELDKTRLVDHASGWYDQGGGDFLSRHVYRKPVRMRNDGRRILALTEFGGYGLFLEGHTATGRAADYHPCHSAEKLTEDMKTLYEKQVLPQKAKGLSVAVYTQLSDIEEETNGLVTYDRKVVKIEPGVMREINRRLKA